MCALLARQEALAPRRIGARMAMARLHAGRQPIEALLCRSDAHADLARDLRDIRMEAQKPGPKFERSSIDVVVTSSASAPASPARSRGSKPAKGSNLNPFA